MMRNLLRRGAELYNMTGPYLCAAMPLVAMTNAYMAGAEGGAWAWIAAISLANAVLFLVFEWPRK